MTQSNARTRPEIPLVSIIINNYNYAQFVGAAIESALAQTYTNIEVIVVDDGSADNSRDVIETFGPRVIKIFQQNGGQGSAYNAGFAACKGDLVHFLDSDDLLLPNAMKEVVECWTPEVAKIHFYLQVLEGSGDTPTEALIPASDLDSGDLRPVLLKTGVYDTPPSSGNTYSRQVLEQILPMTAPQWRTAADLYCIFRSAFLGHVRSVGRPLGMYRVHGANIDAQSEISGELIRYRLSLEEKRDRLLFETARLYGGEYSLGTVSRDFANLKLRLASLLLDKSHHPYPDDTISGVLLRSLKAVLTKKSFSWPKRMLFSAWLLAIAFTPKRWLKKVLAPAFTRSGFSKALRRFLKPAAPSQLREKLT